MTEATPWEVVSEVYNPDEAQLICGLLNMAGIPVKIDREAAGEIYGLNLGPLARITILVPLEKVQEAEKVLAGQYPDGEEPLSDGET